jgi:hypothetical protein
MAGPTLVGSSNTPITFNTSAVQIPTNPPQDARKGPVITTTPPKDPGDGTQVTLVPAKDQKAGVSVPGVSTLKDPGDGSVVTVPTSKDLKSGVAMAGITAPKDPGDGSAIVPIVTSKELRGGPILGIISGGVAQKTGFSLGAFPDPRLVQRS